MNSAISLKDIIGESRQEDSSKIDIDQLKKTELPIVIFGGAVVEKQ